MSDYITTDQAIAEIMRVKGVSAKEASDILARAMVAGKMRTFRQSNNGPVPIDLIDTFEILTRSRGTS